MEEISLRLPFSADGEKVSHLFAYSDISQHMKGLENAFYNEKAAALSQS